ncbi:GNAT family N-acetyltransferase [Jiangella aurantiaca]|uniref:GNAT family N-acetyltransferase n=1 Tax=Jiangella aurantiaca TaxID=2530373 RepID=A0A4R5A381_9ACTN|nr:GNAT family N-acetyltransferase [Jiangella aurantiaca]TDD66281.1 GNAT family N-acetyltransferase [Jiangella aurantiaca]
MNVVVRPVTGADRDLVVDLLSAAWGTTVMAVHGELFDAADQPGFFAVAEGEPAGLLTYRAGDDDWEITTLESVRPGLGAGTALLDAVGAAAAAAGARRLWLITTNDNVHALRFYQRRGFDLVALHRDAVTRSRQTLKPEIPLAADGIHIRHELELERLLR